MTKTRRLGLFALVALLQLAATATSIALYERTLGSGEALRLRLAPVDPVDPLRGHYVALRFEEEQPRSAAVDPDLAYDEVAYAVFDVDEHGYGRVVHVAKHPPADAPYLRSTFYHAGDSSTPPRIELPLDRFYTGKETAAAVDRAFFGGRGVEGAYAVVRVLEGRGVIESLVVDGKDVATGRRVATP